jgi:hypothetical protein
MFSHKLNIIRGNYSTGKTTFLFNFSKKLKEHLNYKICYIGTVQTDFDHYLKEIFDFVRFFDKDIKTTQLVSELILRDKYDFIFIDDIDFFLNDLENMKWLKNILKIPINKIATYSVFPPFYKEKIKIADYDFEIYHISCDKLTTINGVNSDNVIEQFIRNKKIEKLI